MTNHHSQEETMTITKSNAEAAWPYEILVGEANTPEWLDARKSAGVGASESAAILGDTAWGTPITVWTSKRSSVTVDIGNDLMEFGHLAEDVIFRFMDNHPERYAFIGEIMPSRGLMHSTLYPWLFATLDAEVLTPQGIVVPLEYKSVNDYVAREWRVDDDSGSEFGGSGGGYYVVPKKYQIQVQHQMAVTGAPFAYVAAWLGKDRLEVLRVDRDDTFIEEHLLGTIKRFWYDNVIAGVRPRPTLRDNLMEIFPGVKGETITATEEIYEIVAKWRIAKMDAKELDGQLDEMKFAIHDFMGDATELIDPLDPKEVIHTLRPRATAKKIDRKQLEANWPDVYEAVMSPGSGTRVHLATKGALVPLEERV
jgi:putative phage-type endonuclease